MCNFFRPTRVRRAGCGPFWAAAGRDGFAGALLRRVAGWCNGLQRAGRGVHDVAADDDVVGNERVVAHQIDGLQYGRPRVVEAVQPPVEVDAAVLHQRDVLLGNAALLHQVQHLGAVHALHAAVGVADDHHLVDAQFVDRHEQAAHRAVEGVGDRAAGVLDDLHVAVAQAEGRGK